MKQYKVWWPDMGQTQEDAKVFTAASRESAAEDWADWYDHYSSDYQIVGGNIAEVYVLHEGESAPTRIAVHGEMTRTYYARGRA